jgi:hypothetical protein
MPIPPSLTPESELAYAKEILARLERYAAAVRPAPTEAAAQSLAPPPPVAPYVPPIAPAPARDDILPVSVPWPYPRRTEEPAPSEATEEVEAAPTRTRRFGVDPATADLFPYDLAASIVACALTIMVNISFGRPAALGFAVALGVLGEWMRRTKWFPSIGVKLLIGTVVGLVLALTA